MRIKTIEYLINYGADINIKDKYNKSFLDYVKSGTYNVYEYFIQNGTLTWDDIRIPIYSYHDRTMMIEKDSTKVWLLPNTRSPVIGYLMNSDTIKKISGTYIITDEKTKHQNSWVQIKYQQKPGFLIKSQTKIH